MKHRKSCGYGVVALSVSAFAACGGNAETPPMPCSGEILCESTREDPVYGRLRSSYAFWDQQDGTCVEPNERWKLFPKEHLARDEKGRVVMTYVAGSEEGTWLMTWNDGSTHTCRHRPQGDGG
jgi:hypothetical protein